jgi:hypothetical protein
MELKKRLTRSAITTTCEIAGLALVVFGIGTIGIAAGIIAGGVSLILIGYLLA